MNNSLLIVVMCTYNVSHFVREHLDSICRRRMHDSNATDAAKPNVYLYKQVMTILPQLMTIKGMSPAEKKFGMKLLKYYSVFPPKRFS